MKFATNRLFADPEKAARRIRDRHAIERGWLVMHGSGTFVTFTPAGAELFA